MFDCFVIVDWSAANQPKTGRDSIWICAADRGGTERLVANPATRHAAKALLGDILGEAMTRGERVLLGFDFPFGYPAGFAKRLDLKGVSPWRAVWDEIARLVEDDEKNRNNRFVVGAEFNRRVSNGAFPFWGCPAGRAQEHLGPRHHNGHAADGLAEKRLIDTWMVGAQPCWKLAYTGSVGSQVLTGIPVVRALRDEPTWADGARIWPFETGLQPPKEARVVFAEVWPSWWRKQIRAEWGPPNDQAQVRTVAGIFAAADRTGELAQWFDPSLSDRQRHVVETEEAWTLGVMAPRVLRNPSPAMRERVASKASRMRAPALPSPGFGLQPQAPSPAMRERGYAYLRDPEAIYRRSFELIRQEADLSRFPQAMRPLAARLAHAAGDISILADLAWSRGAVAAGRRALRAGAPILCDSATVTAGIMRDRLPVKNEIRCTLREFAVPDLARKLKTTRSAAAVELWRPYLAGAVVAIGNAPTALFRLLEILDELAEPPALVLGFPVGFVGAAEAKEALIGFGRGLSYIALRGRRGGSALAAAAVNALAGGRG